MLVSHRKKFIFVKTQKTAGTSVESFFERYCLAEGCWTQSHFRDQQITEFGMIGGRGPKAKCDILYSHLTAEQIKNIVSEEVWSEYFKFSVIRNPFDRLISRYFFNMKVMDQDYFNTMSMQHIVHDFRKFITKKYYPIIRVC